ncbi:MAG: VWA domain-containing protein, partial [Deltaproteobacteria bacterium]
MNAFRLLSGVAVALSLTACTRTVYVVGDPGGHGDPADEPGGEGWVDGEDFDVAIDSSSGYVLIDGDGVVYVAVDVRAKAEVVAVERAPMNVALVVDRSGSMQGDKLLSARAAALSLLDDLDDGDRVALLSYASDVSVDVPTMVLGPRTRPVFERAIEELTAAGGTALAEALAVGADEVLRGFDEADLVRVILLSDGRPTVGETEPHRIETLAARLYEEGVPVTTMGIGYDYNEDLMTSVAMAGGGNYYYVEDPRETAVLLSREMSSLGRTVARDVELTLELPPEVRVTRVYGYPFDQDGRALRIGMSTLSAGERRRVLVALEVPRDDRGQLPLTRGRLAYRSEAKGARRQLTLPGVDVRYTRDPALVARSMRRPVMEKVAAVRTAEVRRQVVERLDRG